MNVPETRFAKTADGVHIAYQVVGDGPGDIVFVMGWTSHIELMWEEPSLARFLTRLASFSRLILYDKRGMGLSDRVSPEHLPSLEVRMDDARAVMDAARSERAVVLGVSEGGPMATLFAATYPERTVALVLFGTSASWSGAEDYPFPVSSDAAFERMLDEIDEGWGTRALAEEDLRTWAAPSLVGDERATRWLADYERNAASPAAAIALERMNRGMDVRSALPAIHVPSLVLARDEDLAFPVVETRWMAEQIRGAEYIEVPGVDHFFWVGDQEQLLGPIERFVGEVRGREADLDRVLATVLFTDIVSSTAKANELGDRGWRDLVQEHHAIIRAQLGRFRGKEVDTSGDGFFATFDGPARAVRCAQAIVASIRPLGIEVRSGVHTGEVETINDRVGGIAVAIGARVGALAEASQVLVSSTVKDLTAGSGLAFEDAGEHDLKGIPDRWHLYRVVDR